MSFKTKPPDATLSQLKAQFSIYNFLAHSKEWEGGGGDSCKSFLYFYLHTKQKESKNNVWDFVTHEKIFQISTRIIFFSLKKKGEVWGDEKEFLKNRKKEQQRREERHTYLKFLHADWYEPPCPEGGNFQLEGGGAGQTYVLAIKVMRSIITSWVLSYKGVSRTLPLPLRGKWRGDQRI